MIVEYKIQCKHYLSALQRSQLTCMRHSGESEIIPYDLGIRDYPIRFGNQRLSHMICIIDEQGHERSRFSAANSINQGSMATQSESNNFQSSLVNGHLNDEAVEVVHSTTHHSPNGTKYWRPNVPSDEIPVVGSFFNTWGDVVIMYKAYAEKAGFDVRMSTSTKTKGVLTHKYMVCSKQGTPRVKDVDTSASAAYTSKQRNTRVKVTDCPACIKLRVVKGTNGFYVYELIESHNHGLVVNDNMDFTRSKRQLDFSDQQFIQGLSSMGFGATVAHRVQSSLKGGAHLVRGTKNEWKNQARDLRCYIVKRDAQMVIQKLNSNMLHFDNFFFVYHALNGVLRGLFWADNISRINYKLFGDVLAFDATYDTNRYSMIFVPFTGVDNHTKCVTFGAGLIFDETIESFKWLLNAFLEAHGTQPQLVLTDQDAAMKQAVASVLTESTHRLCMWHITNKIPVKISGKLLQNTNIRDKINKLVWNVFIKPETFESRWDDMIGEFHLHENKWLNDMFAIRQQWVPAYFRDIPMCCLMKTTSRCESSNSSFKVFSSPGNTLVQFMICFEMAMNSQRYEQRRLNHETTTKSPKLTTRLPIERHASNIYTLSVFEDVQKEIYKGLYNCARDCVEVSEGTTTSIISHRDKQKGLVGEFKVTHNLVDNTYTCSCMGFTRIGYLCRHIFCVFIIDMVDEIPEAYIPTRWRSDALPSYVFKIETRYGVPADEKSNLRLQFLTLSQQCADRARGDTQMLQLLVDDMTVMKDKLWQKIPVEPSKNKSKVILDLIGCSEPENIFITAPKGIRNKGKRHRPVGPREKAIKISKKKPRLCRTCYKYVTDHDSRNCEKINGEDRVQEDDDDQSDEDVEDEDNTADDESYESLSEY